MTRPLAFITGASSGIGQALAERAHAAGYRLALVARRTDAMTQWAQARGWPAQDWQVYGADVAEFEQIIDVGRRCIERQGLPDVVVANAGISIGIDTAQREDIDVLARLFATNNVGLAATFHPFVDAMRRRGSGRLVGIGSVAAIRGLPGHGGYCASKAGVVAYCESLRGELRGTGVKVVTISPGYVDTPLTQGNRYGMPFMLSPAVFAQRAWARIEKGTSYAVIPWQMALAAKLLRMLPNAVFDRAMHGRGRKRRQSER